MRFGATDFREIGAKNFWHCFWHRFGTKMIFAENSIKGNFSGKASDFFQTILNFLSEDNKDASDSLYANR